MRIATFNANSIRSRLEAVTGWLDRHRPDALGIQETKVQDAEFPLAALEATGYHVCFRGKKGHAGVALLTRDKPAEVAFGLDDGEPEADEDRLVRARLGALHIVNVYVPQGRSIDHPMYRYKIRWLERLRAHFERHFTPRMQVVWLGDMNVAPGPDDIYNSERQANHVGYHEEVRRAFAHTVAWGFEDVFRLHHQGTGHYTYFDYRMRDSLEANKGWRVDHIFATPALARRSTGAWIDLDLRRGARPSDHTVLVADFEP